MLSALDLTPRRAVPSHSYGSDALHVHPRQQYGDGRKRIRNGLLSEKLTLEEMPLKKNVHSVCQRAVTEEEMQRIVDSAVRIGPGRPAPQYDPGYRSCVHVRESESVRTALYRWLCTVVRDMSFLHAAWSGAHADVQHPPSAAIFSNRPLSVSQSARRCREAPSVAARAHR